MHIVLYGLFIMCSIIIISTASVATTGPSHLKAPEEDRIAPNSPPPVQKTIVAQAGQTGLSIVQDGCQDLDIVVTTPNGTEHSFGTQITKAKQLFDQKSGSTNGLPEAETR